MFENLLADDEVGKLLRRRRDDVPVLDTVAGAVTVNVHHTLREVERILADVEADADAARPCLQRLERIHAAANTDFVEKLNIAGRNQKRSRYPRSILP